MPADCRQHAGRVQAAHRLIAGRVRAGCRVGAGWVQAGCRTPNSSARAEPLLSNQHPFLAALHREMPCQGLELHRVSFPFAPMSHSCQLEAGGVLPHIRSSPASLDAVVTAAEGPSFGAGWPRATVSHVSHAAKQGFRTGFPFRPHIPMRKPKSCSGLQKQA